MTSIARPKGPELDSRRRVLFFASQCREMPRLSFLPPPDYEPGQAVQKDWHLAFDLYEQLIDPRAGGCRPVEGLDAVPNLLLAQPGLVINPTMKQAEQALETAIDQAAQEETLLLVYYVGHGKEYLDPRQARLQAWRVSEMLEMSVPRSRVHWSPHHKL